MQTSRTTRISPARSTRTMLLGLSLAACPCASTNAAPVCDANEPIQLFSPSASGYARAGFSVSAAGDLAVVGSYGDESQVVGGGSASIYRYVDDAWTFEAQLLPATPGVGDWFGYSVATDGERIVVGVPYANTVDAPRAGHAVVYQYQPTIGWTVEDTLSYPIYQARFGESVAIDGDRIIVGAPGIDLIGQDQGIALIYHLDDQTQSWQPEGFLSPGTGVAFSRAGMSVAIDMPFALVGAPGDDSADGTPDGGAAYVYQHTESGWGGGVELVPTSPFSNGAFGWSVSIHGDTAAIGSPEAFDNNAGHVTLFEQGGGVWGETQRIWPSYGPWENDFFGEAVAIHADTLIIGGPGRGYIAGYARENGSWSLGTDFLLAPSVVTSNNRFGTSVAVSERAVLVGADSFDSPDTNAGSAFVYQPTCACPADLNNDGSLNFFDVSEYLGAYDSGDPSADLAEPFGSLNFFDVVAYLTLFNAGCP